MKRTAILIITLIILSCSVFPANSAGVSFSLESAGADLNRVVSIGVNCSDSADLGAAVFEFDYDKSALEFKGCDSDSFVRSNISGDILKVVLCNQQSSAELFRLKFRTVGEGVNDVKFNVSECISRSGEVLPAASGVSGVIKTTGKSVNSAKVEKKSTNSASLSGKNNAAKSTKSTNPANDDDGDSLSGDDSDDKALSDLGSLNGVPGKSYVPYVIVACGALGFVIIVLATVFKIRKSLKNNKPQPSNSDKS